MPAESVAQQRFMGAELNRLEQGEKTKTGMSEQQLRDFASTKTKGLPYHVSGHTQHKALSRMKP